MTKKAEYLEVQTQNSTGFDNTFQALGVSLTSPSVLVKIINNSTIDIDISLDTGTTSHDFVPAKSFFLYDMRANRGQEFEFVFPIGTLFSIRGAAAGTGLVYLVVLAEVL